MAKQVSKEAPSAAFKLWFMGVYFAIVSSLMGSAFTTIAIWNYKKFGIDLLLPGIASLCLGAVFHGLWMYARCDITGWKERSGKPPEAFVLSALVASVFLFGGWICHEAMARTPSEWFGVYLALIGASYLLGCFIWAGLLGWNWLGTED